MWSLGGGPWPLEPPPCPCANPTMIQGGPVAMPLTPSCQRQAGRPVPPFSLLYIFVASPQTTNKADISLSLRTLPRSAILTHFHTSVKPGSTLLLSRVHPIFVVPCERVTNIHMYATQAGGGCLFVCFRLFYSCMSYKCPAYVLDDVVEILSTLWSALRTHLIVQLS